jgi:hypothetical protein
MRRFGAFVTFVAEVLLFACGIAGAQVTTGIINGRVSDSPGAVLPGVAATVAGVGLMGSKATLSDEQGVYRFNLLPPGTHSVTFDFPGFATFVWKDVEITPSFTATVNAELQVASASETVKVARCADGRCAKHHACS